MNPNCPKWFVRLNSWFISHKLSERIVAYDANVSKGKKKREIKYIKLLKPFVPKGNSTPTDKRRTGAVGNFVDEDTILGEGGYLIDTPLESQVYRLVCMAGEKGAVANVNNNNNKNNQ